MTDLQELINLKNRLAKENGFDPDKVDIYKDFDFDDEYGTVYDGEPFSSCLSWEDAMFEIQTFFKGLSVGKKYFGKHDSPSIEGNKTQDIDTYFFNTEKAACDFTDWLVFNGYLTREEGIDDLDEIVTDFKKAFEVAPKLIHLLRDISDH